MDRRQHLRDKKRRDRAAKLAERDRYLESRKRERLRLEQYPEISLDPTDATPEFLAAVRAAVAQLDFDDPSFCNDWYRAIYKTLRREGVGEVARLISEKSAQLEAEGDPRSGVLKNLFAVHLGSHIFNRIPEELRRNLLPYNDMLFRPTGNRIVLTFSAMLSAKGRGGTIYFARRKPTVTFSQQEYVVGFSGHAVDRISERLSSRPLTYGAAGDIHAFFSDCTYFEPIDLPDGQPAIGLYDLCDISATIKRLTYLERVLGKQNFTAGAGRCYHRVGYCPVAFDREFAIAKTFLYPGYRGTPEHAALRSSSLPRTDKELLLTEASTMDPDNVHDGHINAIRWFHHNGIPQVVQMKRDVFVTDRLLK